jgi:hypothetical protein
MLGKFRHVVFGGLTALALGASIIATTSEPAAAQWGRHRGWVGHPGWGWRGGWGGHPGWGWHRGWGWGGYPGWGYAGCVHRVWVLGPWGWHWVWRRYC